VHKRGLAQHVSDQNIANAPPLVMVKDVCVSFNAAESSKMVLRDVSLDLRRGELHMLVGANGCGKVSACWGSRARTRSFCSHCSNARFLAFWLHEGTFLM
jgi:hypothetical protein